MSKTPSPLQQAREVAHESFECTQRISRIKREKAALKIDPSKPAVEAATQIVALEKKHADDLAIQEQALRLTEDKLPPLWESARADIYPKVQSLEKEAREIQSRASAAVQKALAPLIGEVQPFGSNATLTAASEFLRDVIEVGYNMANNHGVSVSFRVEAMQKVLEAAPAKFAEIETGIAKLEEAAEFLTTHFPAADQAA